MRPIGFHSGPRGKAIFSRQSFITIALAAVVLLVQSDTHAETRVAVLGSHAAGVEKLVPLVELRLGQKKEITLLERENIKEIFREQELQALMTAEGTAKRIALGKLLKADLLVLVQGEEKPQPHARVTICETKQGLRLCNQPVEFSKSIEADADAVLRVVEKTIEKQRRPIDNIVAVPPFVNNTLAYEGDHLKAACARLIEEMLMDQPGVLVVELAEAKAIAQELTVAGGTVERRLPLYLMGEYRLEGAGGKRKVRLDLKLLRGASEIDSRRPEGSLEDLPRLLREAAGEIFFKALGQSVKPPDPEAEVRLLAERARRITPLGNWDEALALTEAALLLKPDRYDLHGDAVQLLSRVFGVEEHKEFRQTYGKPRSNGPTHRLAKALLPADLYHAEVYMSNTRLDRYSVSLGSPCSHFWSNLSDMPDRQSYSRYLEENKAEIESIRAMCRRVLAAKAAAKIQDQSLQLLFRFLELPIPLQPYSSNPNPWRNEYLKEHIGEICAGRLKLLQDFSYLSESHLRGFMLEIRGGESFGFRLCQEPAYLDFLRKAEGLPSPEIRAFAKNLQRYNREREARRTVQAKSAGSPPPPHPSPAPPPVKPPTKDPEVMFHPLTVANVGATIFLWSPIGEGCDLVLAGNQLLIMKEKDSLRPLEISIGMSNPSDTARGFTIGGAREEPINVAWDGRYVWALNPGKTGPLSVIDPGQRKVWKLGPEGGLPASDSCAVTGLAPGKVCVAGYFGRLWCGIATFDPKTGIKLEVFHEAREVADLRKKTWDSTETPSTKLAEPVFFLSTLRAPGGDGRAAMQRVILGRGTMPLLIDPEKHDVKAVSCSVQYVYQFFEHDGAIYWGDMHRGIDSTTNLYRLGFPNFQKELINPRFPIGTCVVYQGRVHVVNYRGKYLVADSIKGNFRELRGDIPAENQRLLLRLSNHYGLLLLTGSNVYRVELKEP